MRRFHLPVRRAVVGLVLGLVVASCGDADVDTLVVDAEAPTELSAVDSVTPAALLAQAADQSTTGLEVSFSMELGGLPEFGGEDVSFSALIATSSDGSASRFMIDFGDLMTATAAAQGEPVPPEFADFLAAPFEIREVDGTAYISSGFFSWLFPVDTPWLSYPADEAETSGFDTGTVDPDVFVAVLDAIGEDAEIVGIETIDGVPTTHIRGRVTAAGLAAVGQEDFLDGLDMTDSGALDLDELDLDVWLLEDGGVRRIAMGVEDLAAVDPEIPPGGFFLVTIDLVELDGPLVVEAPPAADVTAMDDAFAATFSFED